MIRKGKILGFVLYLIVVKYLFIQEIKAQENPNLVNADIITYQQYLKGEWDSLLTDGNRFIDEGIDFYYLRLRLGIAFYNKQNYAKAIQHFEKAFEIYPSDSIVIEYLYYANLFKGHDFEAKIWRNKLTSSRLQELGIKPGFIEGYSADITYNFSPHKTITEISNSSATGSQQVARYFVNGNLALNHMIGERVEILHAYTFLVKNNLYYTKDASTGNTYQDNVLQNQYFISGAFYPIKGIQVSASFHNLWISLPVTSLGNGFGQGQQKKSFSTTTDFSYSASILKSFGFFNIGYTYTSSSLNLYKQKQHALHLGLYPLGNLNLYLLNKVIFFNENTIPERNSIILGETFGIKLSKHCWAEAHLLTGNIQNMSDYGSYIIYNSINAIKLKSGISLLFPFSSGKVLSFRSNYYQSESIFSGYSPVNNALKYSSISVTGGISWNL